MPVQHVIHVVLLGAYPKMIGIHASPVIARMPYDAPFGVITHMKNPGRAMRGFSIAHTESKQPVPV